MGDFLGTETVATKERSFLPFDEARQFVRGLKLTLSKEKNGWREYCGSGEKPSNIPSNPDTFYDETWSGWPDWLGKK